MAMLLVSNEDSECREIEGLLRYYNFYYDKTGKYNNVMDTYRITKVPALVMEDGSIKYYSEIMRMIQQRKIEEQTRYQKLKENKLI